VVEHETLTSQHTLCLQDQASLSKTWLADVYDQYYQPIYRYIFRQVGDMETSRELSGEVFHRLIKALQVGSNPDQHIAPWLYRTAHNLVVDHYRRQKHRQHLPLNDAVVPSVTDTEQDAEIRFSADAVRAALQELTADQKQVILLKYIEGLSNQEVADLMNKSVGAVKSLQHRALTVLRQRLSDLEMEGRE
jgi:RNA polymerase sigma-70 factor (ECF subfamily)